VTSLLTYIVNEVTFRRSRSPEKRRSHREAADHARRNAVTVAVLVGRLDEEQVTGWCSGCFERSTHVHVRGHDRPSAQVPLQELRHPHERMRGTSLPPSCDGRPTRPRDARYCAQHTHAIARFEKVTARLSDLDKVEDG
jgi:hypothetical protein